MSALRVTSLPDAIRNEVVRLKGMGFPLLPLGGEFGKAPLLRAWAGIVTMGQVLAPMHRTGSTTYGVRLDGLAVIDCDSDSTELVAQIEARFGQSPVHVKTPRGRHIYYRANGPVPNLRAEGLPVDIKTGARSYVVGPLSLRPDGGFYDPVKGLLGNDVLPCLRCAVTPKAALIPAGHRHNELVRQAMQMVELVDSADELQANLAGIRDDCCDDPASMTDRELQGIAEWAWQCRLGNRIYRGRDSAFRVQRVAIDALRGLINGADAIALMVLLEDQHGHNPGKRFPLDFEAIRVAGLINLSISRLRAARRTLEGVGLLRLASKHRAGSRPQTFILTRIHPSNAKDDSRNTLPGKQGGGSSITYDARIPTYKYGGRDNN